jgi:hypothetical protein
LLAADAAVMFSPQLWCVFDASLNRWSHLCAFVDRARPRLVRSPESNGAMRSDRATRWLSGQGASQWMALPFALVSAARDHDARHVQAHAGFAEVHSVPEVTEDAAVRLRPASVSVLIAAAVVAAASATRQVDHGRVVVEQP